MNDSHNIVNGFLIYRITGIALLQHSIHNRLQILFLVKGDHILAVGHNILGFCVIELHDVLDHLGFIFLDDALLMGLIYHGNDLLFCHRLLCLVKGHSEGACRQLGDKGNAHGKRI